MPRDPMADRIEHVFNRLEDSKTKVLAYDSETSGLNWRKNHIVGHVLTFGPHQDDTHYLPVRHAAGGNIPGAYAPQDPEGGKRDVHPIEKRLAAILSKRKDLTVVFHHGVFDLMFMHAVGIVLPRDMWHEDTMVNQGLLNEHSPSLSLDACARDMRVQAKKTTIYQYLADKFGGEPKSAQMGNFWRLSGSDPDAVDYAAGDGITTYALWAAQQGVLDLEDLRTVWAVECRNIPVVHRMMWRGVKVDEEQLNLVNEYLGIQIKEAAKKLPKDFNVRSVPQITKLFRDAGFKDEQFARTPPSKTFPNGQPSFKEPWLQTNELGRSVVILRRYTNLRNSFINPLLTRHLYNGRVHPFYHQSRDETHGTITGRYSCSEPNMQQVPKRNKELGTIFRSIFVPDEGMLWGSVDYSQCEPRLLAHYGRVRVLVEGYTASPPVDAHSAVARAAEIDRDDGKRLNQAIITGAGMGKVLAMLVGAGKDGSTAKKVWDNYHKSMPEIKALQKQASSRMRQRGYVQTLLKRRARLADPSLDYQAVNRLLQCGNADIIKLAMAEVDEYLHAEGDETHLLASIHDDLGFQFWEERRHEYEKAQEMMKDFGPGRPIQLRIPMEVESGEGNNWAVASYGAETAAKYLEPVYALRKKTTKRKTKAA